MTWAQWALLLSRHVGEVPNIISKGTALVEASPWQPKNEALRGLSEAFDPLFADLDSQVGVLQVVTEAEAEASLKAALDDGNVHALGLLDRLRQLKAIYEAIQPWLGLIGIPAPPLPFANP